MRGKSVDVEFVASFVQDCIVQGKTTPGDICEEAIRRISEIDDQLKLRTKLVDVLSHFNYKKKITEAKKEVIDLKKINKTISSDIMALVSDEVPMTQLMSKFEKFNEAYKKDIMFTFKQLLSSNILSRTDSGNIVKGNNYELYAVE